MHGKGYGWIEFTDDEGYEHSRKLNSEEREQVLTSYIRRRSGRKFTVPLLHLNVQFGKNMHFFIGQYLAEIIGDF